MLPRKTPTTGKRKKYLTPNTLIASHCWSRQDKVLKLSSVANIGPKPDFAHMERCEGDLAPKWLLAIGEEPDDDTTDDVESSEALAEELASECRGFSHQ